LDFSVSWQGSQLGAVTKLVFARDRGWRGGVELSAALKGKPSDLTISALAAIQDFRRYDIMGGGNTRLATQCTAHFDSGVRQLQNLDCQSAVGDGKLRLTGEITDPLGPRSYHLTLTAERVPTQALVNLARRAKKDLPQNLVAAGLVQAAFTAKKMADGPVVYAGGGETTPVTLGDSSSDTEAFELGKIEFVAGDVKGAAVAKRKPGSRPDGSSELKLSLLPFPVSLGRPAPAIASGALFRYGYGFKIEGEGQIQRLLQLAHLLGLPGAQPAADGIAAVGMKLAGTWTGFAAPRAEGTAQFRGIRAEVRGTSSPIEISSGQLSLTQEAATFEKLTVSAAGGHWIGKIVVPRRCEGNESCFARFDMQVDALSTEEVSKFLTPSPGKRPWYRVLSGTESSGPSSFATLRASGTLHVGRLSIRKLIATKAASDVELNKGVLRLSDLRAQVLGGTYNGGWTADFNFRPPSYLGDGQFERVSLSQVAELLGGNWVTGVGSGKMHIKASGNSMAALQERAEGVLEFDMRDGQFPHVTLREGGGVITVQKFSGRLERRDGKFEIREGKLETAEGIYQVSGTVSAGNKLDMKLARTGGGYAVTGTLAQPRVVPDKTPTQAALKP
jgi:hypothetical protein